MKIRINLCVGILLTTLTASAMITVSGGMVGAMPIQPPVQWAPCEDAPMTPPRECAEVPVPLDYSNQAKGTTPLHIARVKATDPAHYKGTLLLLPGGPPSAGADYVGWSASIDREVPPALQKNYDILGIDQIGDWDGIQCSSGSALKDYWETNHLPKSSAELQKVTDLEKNFNQGCTSSANPLAPYMNTARSVRDIDTIRQAMNVPQFNLLSYSYGTALAHAYMSQYTSHVGRAVLDSIDDRSVPDQVRDIENNTAFEKSWQSFKDWCQQNTVCVLHDQSSAQLDQLYDKALTQARSGGIPAPRNPFGARQLDDWEFTVAIEALTGAGEATRQWAGVTLRDAANGDGSQAEYLYDLLTGRRLDGSYVGGDGTSRTIGCNDTTWSQIFRTPQDVQNWSQLTQVFAPRHGAASVFQGVAQCYGWSLPPVNPGPHIEPVASISGALLFNADNDASAPIAWAKRVQAQIPNSRLVVVSGSTHLQILHSRCAIAFATDYLLNGVLPANNSTCTYDADLIPPQLPELPPASGPSAAAQSTRTPQVLPELLTQLKEQALRLPL